MKTFVMAAIVAVAAFAAPVSAQETAAETYSEIKEAFGFVPTFMQEYPEHGIRGAWIMTRDMEFSDQTELSPKVKALINVAVGAQIPCRYYVFADTQAALAYGEIIATCGWTKGRDFDRMIAGQHRPNAELTAQGFANIASSLFAGSM